MKLTWNEVKAWVVKKASVTKPYNKDWSASVTLDGYDYNETAATIEGAYKKLTDHIYTSEYLNGKLFKLLNP